MTGIALDNKLSKALNAREANSRLRKLEVVPAGLVDFSSNDFLSLSTNQTLKNAFLQELYNCPLGSGGSRLLDGNSEYIEALERDVSDFHGGSDTSALMFSSGFDANVSVFSCIPQPGDYVVYDEYIHASVHDGMRLSRAANCFSFKHNSLDALLKIVCDNPTMVTGNNNTFIALESVYSMDGDIAPLKEIVEMVEKIFYNKNAYIIVDEAHATGVTGAKGRGLVCRLGLEDKIFIRLHTFGKALSCNGAVVICSDLTRRYLINYARPLIYSTSMSYPMLAAIRVSYTFLQSPQYDILQTNLWELIGYFHTSLKQQGFNFQAPSSCESAIFSLVCDKPRDLSAYCQQNGVLVRPIVFPTVPKGLERVRICIHAGNTVQEVDLLISILWRWSRKYLAHL